jgi:predicted amidophosphoribosyltransferase
MCFRRLCSDCKEPFQPAGKYIHRCNKCLKKKLSPARYKAVMTYRKKREEERNRYGRFG